MTILELITATPIALGVGVPFEALSEGLYKTRVVEVELGLTLDEDGEIVPAWRFDALDEWREIPERVGVAELPHYICNESEKYFSFSVDTTRALW